MQLDKEFVKNALSNAQMINGDFAPNSSFSVDTRTLQPGDVFVALQGQQCDGHQFVGDALAIGSALLASRSLYKAGWGGLRNSERDWSAWGGKNNSALDESAEHFKQEAITGYYGKEVILVRNV